MTDTSKPKRARRFVRTPETGATVPAGPERAAPERAAVPASSMTKAAKAESKTGKVIALLERPEGATLEEMIAATGWLPHTTRAALAGLRKKGHTITRDRRDDVTCYRAGEAS